MLIQWCKEKVCVVYSDVEVSAGQILSPSLVFFSVPPSEKHPTPEESECLDFFQWQVKAKWFYRLILSKPVHKLSEVNGGVLELAIKSVCCLLATLFTEVVHFEPFFSPDGFLTTSHQLKPRINFPIIKSRSSFQYSL